MSESSFPFGTAPEAAPDTTTDEGGRKPVAVVGALVGALVLAGGGFFLLGGDDAVDDELTVPVKRPAKAEQTQQAAAPPAVALPVSSEEPVGRNPFKALYVPPTEGSSGGSTTTADGTTTGGATGGGTTTAGGTTGGTTTGSGTGTTGTGSEVEELQTLTVELVRVDEATAHADFIVTKSGEKTPVAAVEPGHDFGSYFRYIGWGWSDEAADKRVQCARVLIGDALVDICQQDSYEVKTS